MVVAIDFMHVIAERAAHGHPHHHLDAFGAAVGDKFFMLDFAQTLRVLRQVVEEGGVELGIDHAGALTVNLVRHAASAEHHYFQIFREGFHGFANGFAQTPAAIAARYREHHHVHRNRDYGKGPFINQTASDVHRDGQTVVDIQFVHHTHVEFVDDQRFCQMPGQCGVTLDYRHFARAPAFIGRLEFVGHTDGESRNGFQGDGAAMVVVDDDGNVGFVLAHPLLCGWIAVEQGLPVRILGQALVESSADGGNVGTTNTCSNFCHLSLTPVR